MLTSKERVIAFAVIIPILLFAAASVIKRDEEFADLIFVYSSMASFLVVVVIMIIFPDLLANHSVIVRTVAV